MRCRVWCEIVAVEALLCSDHAPAVQRLRFRSRLVCVDMFAFLMHDVMHRAHDNVRFVRIVWQST
jgi:hypothetical protein